MRPSSTPLHYSIPSNKFYPPHIEEKQSLFRSHLIQNILPSKGRQNKIVAIEAQAGQGKTTLAYQYITHNKYSHIWYQIGKEDSDPVLLLNSLLHNLSQTLKDFSSPQLSQIINEGEIGPLDLDRCVNLLLNDIDKYLVENFYIVFDDLHLIYNAELTNNLIAYLLDTSPPKLHFVLTSRHPFELKSKTIRNHKNIAYLSTEDLALSSREIETLFNDVYSRSISITDAVKIQEVTSGWVMGIVLAAHPMSGGKSLGKSATTQIPLLNSPNQKHMLEYFQDEIFSHIPENLHKPFLLLAFVDEIHVDLAARITQVSDIGDVLTELTQENLFIYNLDTDFRIFRFHHLFQEFLQARAKKKLKNDEISQIYLESASFFLENNQIDKALSCYQQGGDYKMMERLLRQHGIHLLAQNRTLTILTLLQRIPEKILLQHGWLSFFAGLLGTDYQPEKTLPLFEAARSVFIKSGEDIGELLTLTQIIYYHFVITGRYHTGADLLPRTEELLLKHRENLSKHLIILVNRNLAAGYCFFSADMEKAREYINQAQKISIDYGIRNFMALTVFIQAYIELLSGNRTKFRREVELSYSLLNDPLVGMSNKLTLRVMHICNLSMHGDILNYFHQQQLILNSIDEKVVKQTVAAPYFYVWGCSCFVSVGETAKGLELINKGINVSATAKSEHMLSQMLQWQAYILAIHGNAKSAEVKIGESAKLRKIAGGPFYESFHAILAGAVYARIKKKKLARDSFTRALQIANAIPSPYLQACCYMHRSYFLLTSLGEKAALKDLEKGLTIMQENAYDHFWSWEPETMLKILSLAVVKGIQKPFCKDLARKRMKVNITNDGGIIPLLYFNLLDGFNVKMGKKSYLTMDHFTPMQRELLSLLLTSKNRMINQDKIQLILWPESSPQKSRKKLDTLLGRLRNTFNDNLGVPAINYLVLNKGILCLENSTTDTEDFLENCNEGLKHSNRDEFWQAGNRFHRALSLWKGNLPSDIFSNDTIYSYEDSLLSSFEKISLTWAKTLADAGRINEAIPLVEKMLRANGLEENGVVLLCQLYNKINHPHKMRETLQRYSDALKQVDYEEEEIESMIEDITAILSKEENPS